MYDYVIIGGGIAGLYFAHKMIEKKPETKMLLLESLNRFGGRVETKTTIVNKKTITYECGAAVYLPSHKLVKALIKELDLVDKVNESKNKGVKFISKSGNEKLDIDKYLTPLKKKIVDSAKKNETEQELIIKDILNKNLYETMVEYLGKEDADKFVKIYVYRDELFDMNAIDAMRFVEEKNNDVFYSLSGGLNQIIDKLVLKIKDKIDMKLNQKVVFINLDKSGTYKVGTEHGDVYKCKNVIIACPRNAIKKININKIDSDQQFDLLELLDMVSTVPAMRVYATFPPDPKTNKSWFNDLDRFSTDPPIKYVIPMGEDFIMITYTDSLNAQIIKAIYERGDLKKYLEDYFRDLFPNKNIPNISKLFVEYHGEGIHYWNKGFLGKANYEKLIKPISDRNMYIIGESYSIDQAWVNGALLSADLLVNRLK